METDGREGWNGHRSESLSISLSSLYHLERPGMVSEGKEDEWMEW